MYTEHHQDCPFCQMIVERPQHFIEENSNYFSLVNISPYSEGHVLIITKEPRTNIIELTTIEWENLLPILKNSVNRVDNTFHPQGFNLVISTGKEGGSRQTVFHFHLHVIPEYQGSRGAIYLKRPHYTPNILEYEEIEKNFVIQKGVIWENDKALVNLVNREQSSDKGHMIIISKKPIKNDVNKLDSETWIQMGELLRQSLKEIKNKLDPSSLRICIFLGEIGGLISQENSHFQIHLVPRYKTPMFEGKHMSISTEVVELAERLKKADNKTKLNSLKEKLDFNSNGCHISQERELINEIKRLRYENERLVQENKQLKKELNQSNQIEILSKNSEVKKYNQEDELENQILQLDINEPIIY